MFSVLAIASLLLLLWTVKKLAHVLKDRRPNAPYPPGPPPKPLIGNMFDFPLVNGSEEYMRWGEKYKSDILYANVLGNHVVVLNKLEDVDELFDRRARKYSDRPTITITKLMGWSYNSALLRYGDEWRRHRRIYQQNFRSQVVHKYYPLQLRKVHEMLKGLLETPEEFEKHNKMLSISIPMHTMYGYDVESIDDPCISAADESMTLGAQLVLPGANFIDIIPALAYVPVWFPGASSRKTAAEVRRLTEEMMRIPMEFVQKRFREGTAVSSLVSDFLEKKNTIGASKEEEKNITDIAYTVYGAASDTTISATGTFFYLMAIHPEVQKKAQREIDSVIGSNRLPNFEDRNSLPYIEAIYREVMRWHPPLLLTGIRSLMEDDYYKGYFIPKGTTLISNLWSITRDPDVYPDPFSFKPERFIDHNGKLTGDSRILAYGFGRRVCAGKHIASSTLWLTFASVLACFNIVKAKDEFGNDIEINDNYQELGPISQKTPFKCSFTPRFTNVRELIAEAN